MSERKLAHIEKIDKILPIENADKLELAIILGWQCVVKKGEFKEGDLVIYVEIDSVLPETPDFEFLRKYNFRIKTQKLRGVISQGLVLPLINTKSTLEIGDDVTNDLGITKYLSPSELAEFFEQEKQLQLEKNRLKKFMMKYSWFRKLFLTRKQKEGFPYWVSKTDEERIQNIPQVLEQFKDKIVYVTEKIDYQSVTFTGKLLPNTTPIIGKFLPKQFKFIVCSRNLINNNLDSLYWKIAFKYKIQDILKENPTLIIQGEQGDGKVQGNKYKIKEPDMWVFNVIDYEKNYHYNREEMEQFCTKYSLKIVPLLKTCKLSELGSTVEEIINYSKGKSTLLNVDREGVVIRCIEDGKKLLSFKAINPDFLIKND